MTADSPPDLLASRRGAAIVGAAIVIVFLALRVTLLLGRDVFFDELFTHWIAAKSFAGILEALRHDSGPPFYYFVVHAIGNPSIMTLRVLSLIFATLSLVMILCANRLSAIRFTAAALLAVFPPAVLFAVDARAYALCALCVTLGILAIVSDRPYAAALAFVLAAYTHYYGVLFFPAVLFVRASARQRIAALILAFVLFAPGFWLASRQPAEAMGWLGAGPVPSLQVFAFAGDYPASLFAPSPAWLVIIALVVSMLIVVASRRRSLVFAAVTLTPVVIVCVLRLASRNIYFPMRFESVMAAPLVLWLTSALDEWQPTIRRPLAAAMLVTGLIATYLGIADHLRRPIDDYRAAAIWIARSVPANETVVASGYCYLETMSVHSRVVAFPPEQGLHPGWRAKPNAAIAPPAGSFFWIVERGAPEIPILVRTHDIEPLYANHRAIVALVRPR